MLALITNPYFVFPVVYLEICKTCGERILDIKYVLHFTVHLSFRIFCPYKYFLSHAEGMHKNTCL
jgi:hypothetical protein